MAIYYTSNANAALQSVEFTPTPSGNRAFITLAKGADSGPLLQWLDTPEIAQRITSKTTVNGQTLLVSNGPLREDVLLQKLADHGEQLTLSVKKPPVNWWSFRGFMGLIGQAMQFISACTQVEKLTANHPMLNPANAHFNPKLRPGMWVRKPFAVDIGVFSTLNLIANFANIFYGGQEEKDVYRLRYVKHLVNEELAPHLKPGEKPLAIDDTRKIKRADPPPPPTTLEKLNDFAKHNSVRFFELGLRSLAALALVFPFDKARLANGLSLLKRGMPISAYKAASNTNHWKKWAGFGYLTGKTIAWFSKVPDPYDPKPHTLIDDIREKVLFPVGSLIETAAGSSIAYTAFRNQRIGLKRHDVPDIQPHTDWLGTAGGSLFASAYIIRLGANFGSKNIDMDEVIAHSSDMLAKTPPEQMPQLLADTAAMLTSHFADPKLSYGVIYQRLRADLQKYHSTLPRAHNENAVPTEPSANNPPPPKSSFLETVKAEKPSPIESPKIISHVEKFIAANANASPGHIAI